MTVPTSSLSSLPAGARANSDASRHVTTSNLPISLTAPRLVLDTASVQDLVKKNWCKKGSTAVLYTARESYHVASVERADWSNSGFSPAPSYLVAASDWLAPRAWGALIGQRFPARGNETDRFPPRQRVNFDPRYLVGVGVCLAVCSDVVQSCRIWGERGG